MIYYIIIFDFMFSGVRTDYSCFLIIKCYFRLVDHKDEIAYRSSLLVAFGSKQPFCM